jgi:ribosomal protein S18 acetylase RimI-like enzyme
VRVRAADLVQGCCAGAACCALEQQSNGATIKVTTRPATVADTEFARRVHHAAYRDVVERQFGPWDAAAQDSFFASNWGGAAFEILLADGVPCGYVCIEDREAEADVHVRELVIAPDYQGRGIGTALLRGAQARARARGVPVHLGTFTQNRALALYRRLGFRELERTDRHVLLRWAADS